AGGGAHRRPAMGRRRQHLAARFAPRPPRPTGAPRDREPLERGHGLAPTLPPHAAGPHRARGVSRAAAVGPVRGGRAGPGAREARRAQLPSGARMRLETLALAGQPLDAAVARDVAGLQEDERQLVALLQAERWLKDTRSAERLELYHDGIRRALLARIDPSR